MSQTVIANLVQLHDAANKLETSAQAIMIASDKVHSHIQTLRPERYDSNAADNFRAVYSSSREHLNAVAPLMLTMAKDLRAAIERIAEASGVSSASQDLQYWSQQQHMKTMQAQFSEMNRNELLDYLEQNHLQFCGVYDKLSDAEIRKTLFYLEFMETNGFSRSDRSAVISKLLAGETDLKTIRQNAISSFKFTVDLPKNVDYGMIETSRVRMETAHLDAAKQLENYELAIKSQSAQLQQNYIDWRTGNSGSKLDGMRRQVYSESLFGGSVDSLDENSFWADVEYGKSVQVYDGTINGFRNSIANWAETNNYHNGMPYGVGSTNDIGRHCTTYVTTAMRENGYPIDVIHGNSQLHNWMQDHPGRWEYTHDLNSLEAGDFVFMNWPGRGTIDQSLANGAGISHVVLITGSGEYAQWNSELVNQPITQIPERAGDYIGVRMLY